MAGFNVGAGLAAMGDAIGKTAQAITLETQRAELQRESLILADQLASERESRGRAEGHANAKEILDKTQVFTAGENDKNRANSLATANISAGASMANARLAADTQLTINDRNLKARSEEHDKTIAASLQGAAKIQIDNDGNIFSINPATGIVTPLKAPDGSQLTGRDPEVARAMTEVVKATTSQLNDVTRSYVPQITALEATLRKLQADPLANADKTVQKEIADTQTRLRELQQRFEGEKAPLTHKLNEYERWLRSKGKMPTTPSTGGRPPLSELITVPGAKPPSGLPPSLIDTPY